MRHHLAGAGTAAPSLVVVVIVVLADSVVGVVELVVVDPAGEPVPLVLGGDQPQVVDPGLRPRLIGRLLGVRMHVPADLVRHGMPERSSAVVDLDQLKVVGIEPQLDPPPAQRLIDLVAVSQQRHRRGLGHQPRL